MAFVSPLRDTGQREQHNSLAMRATREQAKLDGARPGRSSRTIEQAAPSDLTSIHDVARSGYALRVRPETDQAKMQPSKNGLSAGHRDGRTRDVARKRIGQHNVCCRKLGWLARPLHWYLFAEVSN
jgi:hypothetical protein